MTARPSGLRWLPLLMLAVLAALTGAGAAPAVHAQASAAVTIKNFAFTPNRLTVTPGTTVTWTNEDQAPHTATSGTPDDADAGSGFDSPELHTGESYSHTFDAPGTYVYFCRVHPNMRATVVVGSAPAAPAAAQPSAPPVQSTQGQMGESGGASQAGSAEQPGGASQQGGPGAPAAGPMAGPPPLPANVTVVASGLNNPRGFTWGPDGSLYIAQAGRMPASAAPPSNSSPEGEGQGGGMHAPPTSMTGSIVRIAPDGTRTTIVDQLPAFGEEGQTDGVSAVAMIGDDLYAIISAGPIHGHADFTSGVYHVGMDGSLDLVVSTDAFNLEHPPAFIPEDDEISNPYDMVALNGELYITDGNRSVIWEVDPSAGSIRYLADMSAGHPVLTGIAVGPDNNLYVTNLTPAPFPPGGAKVWRVGLAGDVTEAAGGISLATGIAVGPDGSIYVSEMATALGAPPFFAPPGRIVKVTSGGVQPVAAPLFFPTMLRWGPDGALYAANFSIGSDNGEGMIVRIDLSAAP